MVGRPRSRKLIGLSLGDHRAEGQHQLPLVLVRYDVKEKYPPDSGAECSLALRPISVAFFLGALEAFGSAFGVRGNRVQLGNNVLSRNVALNQRADLGVEIDHLFT